jgi:uncharacterized protein YndB with AHSA1/START domain
MLGFLFIMFYYASGLVGIFLIPALIIGLTRKKNVLIHKKTTISKPLEEVYALFLDFHQFKRWNNWLHQDKNARFEITGNLGKVGEQLTWLGNNKIGRGSMRVIDRVPNEKVVIEARFGYNSIAEYTFIMNSAESSATTTLEIYYKMNCGNNPITRWKGSVIKKYISDDILTNLKNIEHELQ